MRFMLYDGALNAARFIAFLRRLAKDAGQKVILIVDNLKVHHAKPVKAWAAAHGREIELCHLPAYAPDHNPDEHLSNDLKQKLRQRPQPGSTEELAKGTRAVLRAIQRSPARIKGQADHSLAKRIFVPGGSSIRHAAAAAPACSSPPIDGRAVDPVPQGTACLSMP
jgi:transposase